MCNSLLILLLALLLPTFAAADSAASPYFVDFSKAANRDLQDDGIANNGRGGWTDEGVNDFFVFPALTFGESVWRGTPFKLLEPEKNNARAVVMLAGSVSVDLPKSVTVQVPQIKGKYLYFMHTCAGEPNSRPTGATATYTLTYSDKSTAALPIRLGHELQRWFVGQWWDNEGVMRYPVYMGHNAQSGRLNQFVGIWATQWLNPEPAKAIVSITFESAGVDVPVIFATTIADADYASLRDAPDNRMARPLDAPAGYFDAKINAERQAIFSIMKSEKIARGIRRLEVIRPDLLCVTIDSALGNIGTGQGEDIAAAFQLPENFKIASEQDIMYSKIGVSPASVSRHTQKIDTRAVGPFAGTTIFWHSFYLCLPAPMKPGDDYTVSVAKLSDPFEATRKFTFDPAVTITPVIKVNQVGYSPLAMKRFAYLGWWAADGGGVDYSEFRKFEVIDEATGKGVLSGDITRRAADDRLSGEQVSEMDLASLAVGRYHIVVPGLGRSYSFLVGGDSSHELYVRTMRAFLHQRCGIALTSAVTDWPHDACHVRVYENSRLVEGNPPHRDDEPIKSFYGGYHDGGDAAVFATALPATAQTLAVFEMFPKAFHDKDLNLPESGHGVPDVLSEAAWGLKFFAANQTDDGGIPFGRSNDSDSIRTFSAADQLPFGLLSAKNSSSNAFAATAAQFSRLIRPYDAARADDMLARSERAYAWAKAHQPDVADAKDPAEKHWKQIWGWAAAELFNTTGKDDYSEDFRTLYLARELRTDAQLGPRINAYLWPYMVTTQPKTDGVIQERLRKSLLDSADTVVKSTLESPYRMGRGPNEGGWGNLAGGGYYGDTCLHAYVLSKDQKYLDAACLNADFQLGANPLGICLITGMGTRFPQSPGVLAALRSDYGKTAQGLSVFGPGGKGAAGYPRTTPVWRCFEDNQTSGFWSGISMPDTIGPAAALYSALWAIEQGR